MCGRYALRAKPEAFAEAFDVSGVSDLPARYNNAPTQPVPEVWLDPDWG